MDQTYIMVTPTCLLVVNFHFLQHGDIAGKSCPTGYNFQFLHPSELFSPMGYMDVKKLLPSQGDYKSPHSPPLLPCLPTGCRGARPQGIL